MEVWEKAGKASGAVSVPCQGPSPGSFPALTCPSAGLCLPQCPASPAARPSLRPQPCSSSLPEFSLPSSHGAVLSSFLNENSFLGVSIFVLIKVIWVCYKSSRTDKQSKTKQIEILYNSTTRWMDQLLAFWCICLALSCACMHACMCVCERE